MDSTRLSNGQRLAGIGGLLLIIFLFLPWFGEGAVSLNGWEGQSTTDLFLLITAIVAIASALPGAAGMLIPGLSLNGAAALLGGVGMILMLWLSFFDFAAGAEREIGVYLSLIATGAIGFGGFMAAQLGGDDTRRPPPSPRSSESRRESRELRARDSDRS